MKFNDPTAATTTLAQRGYTHLGDFSAEDFDAKLYRNPNTEKAAIVVFRHRSNDWKLFALGKTGSTESSSSSSSASSAVQQRSIPWNKKRSKSWGNGRNDLIGPGGSHRVQQYRNLRAASENGLCPFPWAPGRG